MEDVKRKIEWFNNKTSLCFIESLAENDPQTFCGDKDVCSTKGLLLPLFIEETWPRELRAALYFFALIYSFLGVSIVADIFMCAIERITSTTKKITIASADPNSKEDTPEVIEIPVWNGTVANLTLMALGSSAPEILLSIIEIVGNGFESGELGPGTIVGSAAFNLLAISAVCIIGVPTGQTRRIDQIIVFGVTTVFSIFAYIWLLIILKWVSEDVVEVWEAILTLAFFPLLVVIAYAADKKWLNPLFCMKKPDIMDKQRQIELGTLQPGEGTYRTNLPHLDRFVFPWILLIF
jgi:solute carrier family 8 (sodium/calcium exchanger)